MAQRIGPPGSARVAISGTLGTAPWANVFWFNLAGGVAATQAAFDAWVSAVGEAYFTALSAAMPSANTLKQAQGTLFQSSTTALHSTHAMNHAGTSSLTLVSDYSACRVMSWTTNAYWRGGKPRTYIPGLFTQSTTDGRTLTQSAADALRNDAINLLTLFNAVTATGITQTQMGFVSFFSQNAPRPAPLFFAYTSALAHKRIGSQRRRLGPWVP